MSGSNQIAILDKNRAIWILKNVRTSARATITLFVNEFVSPEWTKNIEDADDGSQFIDNIVIHIDTIGSFFNAACDLVPNIPPRYSYDTECVDATNALHRVMALDRDCTAILLVLENGREFEAIDDDDSEYSDDEIEHNVDSDDETDDDVPPPLEDDEGSDDETDDDVPPPLEDDEGDLHDALFHMEANEEDDGDDDEVDSLADRRAPSPEALPAPPIKRSASAPSSVTSAAPSTNSFFSSIW